jgi:hypothetical protein
MLFFIIVGITFFIIGFIILLATYLSHISMNKEEGVPYGWGTYKQFLKLYNKYTWVANENFRWSLFSKERINYWENTGYLHASIFKFNNKCFIFYNPISYFRAVLLIRNEAIKQLGLKEKVNWNKESE